MPQHHRLQSRRFELKYLVSEASVPKIRSFLSSYLELDQFAAGSQEYAYAVHSIYLDSDDLQTYQWWQNGNEDRFKLRIRYYSSTPDEPVFFELKRRQNDCILKGRCGVQRHAAQLVLDGHMPDESAVTSRTPRHLNNLQQFCRLVGLLRARPKAHVTYQREAWVSPNDNSLRVTLDRQTVCEPVSELHFTTDVARPFQVFGPEVVLELKFTERFPRWCREMVEALSLTQTGAAKYAWGVEQLGETRFSQPPLVIATEPRTAKEPAIPMPEGEPSVAGAPGFATPDGAPLTAA